MALLLSDVLARADRRLKVSGMDKDVIEITRDVIKEMHEEGIYICIAQAFRSFAEQNALYAKGRTVAGSIVTNARGGQSNHNYGVAVDLCIYPNTFDKVLFLQPSDPRMKKIVSAMKRRGMKWGGDWSGFPDYPHFELYNKVGGQKKPNLSGVPAVKPTSSGGSVYVVMAGDTLSEIAEKKKVSVAQLKKLNNLKSDLIRVGQKLKLKASTAKASTPKDLVPYPKKPLYMGAKGMKVADIERVQRAVKAKVTGKFDQQTKDAVKAYQKRKGLVVDGIIGSSSWSMMF